MRRILVVLQLPSLCMVLYLDLLSVAAALWRRTPAPVPPRNRFALLVPAYNEEVLLPRLLESISALDFPHHMFDVHVVADNSTDRTAQVAAAGGATVHERQDEHLQGKGYALQWLLARIRRADARYDAFVILDADSVVSPNFLSIMDRHLARGDQVIQSHYSVLNHEAHWSSALRFAALALFNDLRPRGRDALGLSAGLRGNGMCFRAAVIERFGWDAYTLAEDVELHLKLVDAGLRVTYAPDARVDADMPTSLRQATSQNVRWERGRLQMLRTFGPRLFLDGVRRRDAVRLDALAEQLVPPLSVLSSVTLLSFLVAALLRVSGPLRLASLVLLGQIGYVVAGLRLVNAPPRIYLAFLRAPVYVIWKLWIYASAAVGISDNRWIRTPRSPNDR